jgi:regulator of sigma E protease
MFLLEYLIPFALALGVLVVFHEFGHYAVARAFDVKVLRFCVGFGKPLLRYRHPKGETEWVLAAIPLGGYVQMLDEREAPVAPEEADRAFNRQAVGKRFAIVAAGPLANFALAILLYWWVFVAGTQEMIPRIAVPEPNSIAALSGLRDGDRVDVIGDAPIQTWPELRWALLRHAADGQTVSLQIHRDDEGGVLLIRSLDLSGVDFNDAKNDVLSQLGLSVWQPPVLPILGLLSEGGSAKRAGLLEGDRVLEIQGQPIDRWGALVAQVRQAPGQRLEMTILRNGMVLPFSVLIDPVEEKGETIGRLGAALSEAEKAGLQALFAEVRLGISEAFVRAVRQTWETSALTVSMIGKMLFGDVSIKNISGPITIADFAGQSAQMGLAPYLKFLALVSISLGLLNLLPIPVLDGGHLLYYTIEMIKGSPVSERVMQWGQQFGMALLFMLMAFAFYNDINRLVSG